MKARMPFVLAVLLLLCGCRSPSLQTADNSGLDRFTPSWLGREGKQRDRSRPGVTGETAPASGTADSRDLAEIEQSLRQGRAAEAAERWTEARMYYGRVLQVDADNAEAHHRLAVLADKQAEFRRAEEHYLTALRTKPRDPNLLSDLGYSYLIQNRYEESEHYLSRALENDPQHAKALNNLGLLRARRGDYDGALAMFLKAGPERQAMEKMRVLFPDGRPGGAAPTESARGLAQSDPARDEIFGAETRNAAISSTEPAPRPSLAADTRRGMPERHDTAPTAPPPRSAAPGQRPVSSSPADQYPLTWPPVDDRSQAVSDTAPWPGSPADTSPAEGSPSTQGAAGPADVGAGHAAKGKQRGAEPASSHPLDTLSVWPPESASSPDAQQASGSTPGEEDERLQREATRLGMSAGPGVMFPLLPGSGEGRGTEANSQAPDPQSAAPGGRKSTVMPPLPGSSKAGFRPSGGSPAEPSDAGRMIPQINPRRGVSRTAARPGTSAPSDHPAAGERTFPRTDVRRGPARYRLPADPPANRGPMYRTDRAEASGQHTPRDSAAETRIPDRTPPAGGTFRPQQRANGSW